MATVELQRQETCVANSVNVLRPLHRVYRIYCCSVIEVKDLGIYLGLRSPLKHILFSRPSVLQYIVTNGRVA
jgi:hypothetical protein